VPGHYLSLTLIGIDFPIPLVLMGKALLKCHPAFDRAKETAPLVIRINLDQAIGI